VKTPEFHNPCPHPEDRISAGQFYDCCLRCGATRRVQQRGKPPEPWHSCALCVLPGILVAALLALVLAGCATEPNIKLHFQEGIPTATQNYVWEGVSVWGHDCDIDVTLVPKSELPGDVVGLEGGGDIQLAEGMSPLLTVAVSAHEAGHAIFHCARHLPPGQKGVMATYVDGSTTLTEADWAWADSCTNSP
jgi:hypothetical protein